MFAPRTLFTGASLYTLSVIVNSSLRLVMPDMQSSLVCILTDSPGRMAKILFSEFIFLLAASNHILNNAAQSLWLSLGISVQKSTMKRYPKMDDQYVRLPSCCVYGLLGLVLHDSYT